MMQQVQVFLLLLCLVSVTIQSFQMIKINCLPASISIKLNCINAESGSDTSSSDSVARDALSKALENARMNIQQNVSPGAGLLTADEQSDAAYADLINTSMEQRRVDRLTPEQLVELEKGGTMWETDAKTKKNSKSIIGDITNVLSAFFGGAQIEKNKYGET